MIDIQKVEESRHYQEHVKILVFLNTKRTGCNVMYLRCDFQEMQDSLNHYNCNMFNGNFVGHVITLNFEIARGIQS